jgi:hypothetical protein
LLVNFGHHGRTGLKSAIFKRARIWRTERQNGNRQETETVAETMFKTLAAGYGGAVFLAITGAAYAGGSTLSWFLFAWLAGPPLTLIACTMLHPMSNESERGLSTARKREAHLPVAR